MARSLRDPMSEAVVVSQAPLGSREKERFLEWTTISSAWGNSASWMRTDCCWRAAHTMVGVSRKSLGSHITGRDPRPARKETLDAGLT